MRIHMNDLDISMKVKPNGETVCTTIHHEVYHTPDGTFIVPPGFESDGASMPRFFWRLIGHPFSMDYLREAILHDYFYRTQPITRRQADHIFFSLLKKKLPLRSRIIHLALRLFGWIAWHKNKQKGHKMKWITTLLTAAAMLPLTACLSGTSSVITEYDAAGNITKVTEHHESVIRSVTDSTRDKSVIVWESGWTAYLTATAATAEDPTPTLKLGAGKVNKGAITLHRDHKNVQTILPELIRATRDDLTVTASGVTSVK